MPRFTQEQWNEIYQARQRLAVLKDKIQPYPAYPVEPEPEPRVAHTVVHHVHRYEPPQISELSNPKTQRQSLSYKGIK